MFGDIGFWELTLVMVVALLVIGPERMPGLARKAGLLVGKARRFVASVRDDINQELAAEELKRIMKEHQESSGIHEIIEETRENIDEAREAYLVKAAKEDKPASPQEKPAISSDKEKVTTGHESGQK